ncbi:MAG: nucleotidyltransferase domain-containing protein [Burkholderiales bacterium]
MAQASPDFTESITLLNPVVALTHISVYHSQQTAEEALKAIYYRDPNTTRPSTMRLTNDEQNAIRGTILAADPRAVIYLFGSRAEDTAKGGDIDLLVISSNIDLMAKLRIMGELHRRLGERKIDLVVAPDLSAPFPRLAASQGARL